MNHLSNPDTALRRRVGRALLPAVLLLGSAGLGLSGSMPVAAQSEPAPVAAAAAEVEAAAAEVVTAAAERRASVSINSASAEELAAALVGVGQSKAEAIVRYREQFGAFGSIEELTEVRGIGPATLERNRALLSLE